MKINFTLLFLFFISLSLRAQSERYLKLDGNDSNVCIGMDTLNRNWSIEAWIRGDDSKWKSEEVLIGGGEYTDINTIDKRPLVLKDGKLHNTYSGLTSNESLAAGWQHIAITCGDNGTTLYINGKEIAHNDSISSIIPGVIGADEDSASVFGGDMDEVRIWGCQLSKREIKKWMNRTLSPTHPKFNHLKGYYPFNEPTSDMYVNWVGEGVTPYHARNSRMDYYGSNFISSTESSDNRKLESDNGNKRLFNSVEIASEWDSPIGAKDEQMIKLRITVIGDKGELNLNNIKLDFSKSTNIDDISNATLYWIGSTPKSSIKEKICNFIPSKESNLDISFNLESGVNYFLLTLDISDNAKVANTISSTIESFTVNNSTFIPSKSKEFYPKQIAPSTDNSEYLRVLQWNIWHAGIETGLDGVGHVIDMIRATSADIVTMQEAYGSQERIAKELSYLLKTNSSTDNLALFSKHKINNIPTENAFQSNPAIITLPDGKNIYVNSCWLRYAYRPEYTCAYTNVGYDTDVWIKEDEALPMADISKIIKEDLTQYVDEQMPQIISGDFNSCSHLDWTDRTKHLHYGYGAVQFPVSIFMYSKGYLDGYREVHKSELTHQGSTYSPVLGHLQNSRIDFIYHKGNIEPISAKIIRTSEEIDFVPVSDHAAVYIIYKL